MFPVFIRSYEPDSESDAVALDVTGLAMRQGE